MSLENLSMHLSRVNAIFDMPLSYAIIVCHYRMLFLNAIYELKRHNFHRYGIHLTKFDQNGDNEIDYEEFLLLVCRRILREKAIAIDIDLMTGKKITKTERGSTEIRSQMSENDLEMTPNKISFESVFIKLI